MNRKTLVEQIKRILVGGNPRASEQITNNEIKLAIGQAAARVLKAETAAIMLQFGGSAPHSSICVYSENEVVAVNETYSKVKLPVQPIGLPMNIGIFRVFKTGCFGQDIIPVEPGQLFIIAGVLSNKLATVTGDLLLYEPRGDYIILNKSKEEINDTIDLHLVVPDINSLGDYDVLPISADQESIIIAEVLKLFAAYQPHDTAADAQDKP